MKTFSVFHSPVRPAVRLLRCLMSVLGLAFAGAGLAAPPVPLWNFGAAPAPMRPGIAAVTCTSSGLAASATTEHVLIFLDMRDPIGCGATPIITNSSEWTLPLYRRFFDPGWSVANLGEVSGVDVGTGNTSNVYISALGPKPCDWGNSYWANRSYATANNNTGTGGEVWCINGTTHARQLIACLPNHRGFFSGGASGGANCNINGNSFVGLGNLSYSQRFQTLYITNLDDGKIYVVSTGSTNCGTVLCTFDHGALPSVNIPDDPQQLYTQKHRMVFGIEYHPQSNRLFYALRNAANQDEIWSLGLNALGCPVGIPCIEATNGTFTPLTNGAASSLPSDIQFSPDGKRMLVIHQSVTFFPVAVTGITPAGTYAAAQNIVMRYAHASAPWEFTRPNNTPCGGWAVQGWYQTGVGYSQQNAVAGDYGYGDMFATQALDSVVTVAEVIRTYTGGTYKFGLQVHPVGDFTRSSTLMNFDAPLLAPSGVSASTKIQLNDLDILHKPPCMAVNVVAGSVQCPLTAGGNGTVTIQITNNLPTTVFGLSLTNCSPMPLPPGAVGITPLPVALPGGSLAPGATTPPLLITLPNIPINGGTICFCVRLLDESPQGVQCEQMVCVNFQCTPPCMTLAAQNIQCAVNGGYNLNLCITNLQPSLITTVNFSPCSPVPPGATTGVPAVNPVTLANPLPNGSTVCIPLSFPSLPPVGGLFCFHVTTSGSGAQSHPCTQSITVTLPPCPGPCATITASAIVCPTIAGGPYTMTLTITNLTAVTVSQLNIGLCPPGNLPPGAVPVLPSPGGYVTLSPALAPGATTTLPVSLPGLPCTGVTACFCVTLLGTAGGTGGNPEEPPPILCAEMVCIQLPVCPCPPCMSVTANNIRCPDAATGSYLANLTITNLHPVTATHYALTTCPPVAGATTIQPTPIGVTPLPAPLATGNTSTPITISLPAALTGGNFCFCVVLFAADQQTQLCKERVCLTLPKCRCGEATVVSATCTASGATQLVIGVTNNTNLYAAPYNFAIATFSPASGFSPAITTTTPSPIPPGGTGTVTTTYSGPPGTKCFTLIMSNAARTRCCSIQVCFDNPQCEPVPPFGTCTLRNIYFCENGSANVTWYITNNTGAPTAFLWSIMPATVPGCTSTLPPAAFTPASGTTSTLAPFSTTGVSVNINAASIAAGTCAGFQVCFVPVSDATRIPICCTGKLKCPGPGDPCIVIGDAFTLATPGKVIGIPIIIKNPTTATMQQSLVMSDDAGALQYYTSMEKFMHVSQASPDGSVLPPNPYAERGSDEISGDHPLEVSLAPGEVLEFTVFAEFTGQYSLKKAIGNIVIGPPCVLSPIDDHRGSGRIFFGPVLSSDVPAPPISQALVQPRRTVIAGRRAMSVVLLPVRGLSYILEGNTSLLFGEPADTYRIPPSGIGLLIEPDGSFFTPLSPSELGILELPDLRREFYKVSVTRANSTGIPATVSGGR